jgi:hypothetical protein
MRAGTIKQASRKHVAWPVSGKIVFVLEEIGEGKAELISHVFVVSQVFSTPAFGGGDAPLPGYVTVNLMVK